MRPSPELSGWLAELSGDKLRARQVVTLLRQVASQPRIGSAAPVVRWLLAEDEQVAAEAAVTLAEVLQAPASPHEWLGLESALRRHWGSHTGGPPPWLEQLLVLPFQPEVLGALCFHASGWAREAAIVELERLGEPRALAFVLPRLSDWEPVVRSQAERFVRAWLVPEQAGRWFSLLPLWKELERRARQAGRTIAVDPRPLLADLPARPALLAALQDPQPRVQHAAWPLAAQVLPLEQLVELGLAADITTQLRAVEASRGIVDRERALALAQQALGQARGSRVRAAALRRLVALGASPPSERVHAGLLDPSHEVRVLARHFAAGAGVTDVAAHYRQLLAEGSARTARLALTGLGDVATPADVPIFEAMAASPVPITRRMALAALVQRHASCRPLLLHALRDPSPTVSRTARELLRGLGPDAAEAPQLAALVADLDAPAHTRRNALGLIDELDDWSKAPLLVAALRHRDKAIVRHTRFLLEQWLRRQRHGVRKPPEGAALVALALALDAAPGGEWAVQELRLSLAAWRSQR